MDEFEGSIQDLSRTPQWHECTIFLYTMVFLVVNHSWFQWSLLCSMDMWHSDFSCQPWMLSKGSQSFEFLTSKSGGFSQNDAQGNEYFFFERGLMVVNSRDWGDFSVWATTKEFLVGCVFHSETSSTVYCILTSIRSISEFKWPGAETLKSSMIRIEIIWGFVHQWGTWIVRVFDIGEGCFQQVTGCLRVDDMLKYHVLKC